MTLPQYEVEASVKLDPGSGTAGEMAWQIRAQLANTQSPATDTSQQSP